MKITIIVAVQDYKKFGYSNTVHTDKGMSLAKENEIFCGYSKKIASFFMQILGNSFGNEELVLAPFSYGSILEMYKESLQEILKNQRTTIDPSTRYNDTVTILGKKYIVNRRKKEDKFLGFFHKFYEYLKEFYDYGYPLYLTPATEEEIQQHFGNFKVGDSYTPIFPQK